jgi:hypothetical protein
VDPNATYQEISDILREAGACNARTRDLERLADLIAALDDWIVNGGMLPDAWSQSKRTVWDQKRGVTTQWTGRE